MRQPIFITKNQQYIFRKIIGKEDEFLKKIKLRNFSSACSFGPIREEFPVLRFTISCKILCKTILTANVKSMFSSLYNQSH